jgi:hypothetical protein
MSPTITASWNELDYPDGRLRWAETVLASIDGDGDGGSPLTDPFVAAVVAKSKSKAALAIPQGDPPAPAADPPTPRPTVAQVLQRHMPAA